MSDHGVSVAARTPHTRTAYIATVPVTRARPMAACVMSPPLACRDLTPREPVPCLPRTDVRPPPRWRSQRGPCRGHRGAAPIPRAAVAIASGRPCTRTTQASAGGSVGAASCPGRTKGSPPGPPPPGPHPLPRARPDGPGRPKRTARTRTSPCVAGRRPQRNRRSPGGGRSTRAGQAKTLSARSRCSTVPVSSASTRTS